MSSPTPPADAVPSPALPTEEIRLRVRRCVAESLAVPLAEIGLDSRLTDDLGATSLDFIDIVFLVEKELGIRVRDTELAFLTRLDFSSPEVMREGFLTEEVVARLGLFLPALAREPNPAAVTAKRLFSLVTVEALALVVERRLARISEEARTSAPPSLETTSQLQRRSRLRTSISASSSRALPLFCRSQ